MTPAEATALTVGILSGLAAVISALATLVYAWRVRADVADVRRQVNGRLDQLLQEREERLRVEALLAAARAKQEQLPDPPATGRGDPFLRTFPPENPLTKE